MDTELLERLRSAAEAVFAETPIVVAYAHGSRVHGSPRAESDLDVGYYLDNSFHRESLPLRDELAMEGELTRRVGCEVDLRNLGPAPLELRGKVLEHGVRVYCGNESARVAIEKGVLARYHDYKPAFAAMHRTRIAALARGA